MLSSIVHIESANKQNNSFGTGFVIDNDEHGAYILTCKHVLDEVGTAQIEDEDVEIVAKSDFLDMAVIHAPSIHETALPLQLSACKTNKVHSIGFAAFSRDLVQKKEVKATLFDEMIELHSTIDDSFYVVRRIKANEDYSFERGNSGSPVICKDTGAVIGMISNKEGSSIAYAIEIACLQEIWKIMNTSVQEGENLHSHQHFYENIDEFRDKVEDKLDERKESIKKSKKRLNNMNELRAELSTLKEEIKEASKLRYYLGGIASALLIIALYYFFTTTPNYKPENYKVVNVPANDILNIRDGKGTVYSILGTLPSDAQNVAVRNCEPNDAGKEWCNVTYGNINGWVRAYYLQKEPLVDHNVNPDNVSYFRAINEEGFLQFTYSPVIKRGEKILISAMLENLGEQASSGGITLSFPQRPILKYTEDYNDFDSLKHYKIYDEIYNNHKDQTKTMNAIHPTVEASKRVWKNEEKHIFALAIDTPEDLNVFRIRVRASLTLERLIPSSGIKDQQAFFTKEIVIKIKD